MKEKIKVAFFDRDGVVNFRMVKDYVKSIEEFRFIEDFFHALKAVSRQGYKAILVTNQQGVAKGKLSENRLREIFDFMQSRLLEKCGVNFLDIYYCAELAETNSPRRKPNPGMLLEAIEKWNVDVSSSWMIGDSITDAQAGKRAGLKTILIGDYQKSDCEEADFVAINLYEAAKIIETHA